MTNGALQIGNAGVGQTGSGAVTVASGGTILGTGTVRGNTFDLQSGSILTLSPLWMPHPGIVPITARVAPSVRVPFVIVIIIITLE